MEISVVTSSNETGRNTTPEPETGSGDDVRIAAVQEDLIVGVERVERGAIRVRKMVHEYLQPLTVTVRRQLVDVQRVPMGRPVVEKFRERREGAKQIIPVFDYVPVVRMQLTLKEEIHITTERSDEVVREGTDSPRGSSGGPSILLN